MKTYTASWKANGGATLLETLVASGLLAVVFSLLAASVQWVGGQYVQGTSMIQVRRDLHASREWLAGDLRSAVRPRPSTGLSFPESAPEEWRSTFEGRDLFPFEVGRIGEGNGEGSLSRPFVVPEFGSLTFLSWFRVAGEGHSRPCLVSYYVAWNGDGSDDLPTGRGMSLFRHVRNGGDHEADASRSRPYIDHAMHTLHSAVREWRDGRARGEIFANQAVPLWFDRYATGPVGGSLEQGWFPRPAVAVVAGPSSTDPGLPLDEPLCHRVVRFEITPLAWREVGTERFLEGAEQINERLRLSHPREEWPCLVVPDVVEVTLAVVDERVAARLVRRDDWLVDWEQPQLDSPAAGLIRRHAVQVHFRLNVGGASL